jgi:hypothetical protein
MLEWNWLQLKEAIAVWSTINIKQLATLRFECQILIEWLKESWLTGADQLAETIEYRKSLMKEITVLKQNRQGLEMYLIQTIMLHIPLFSARGMELDNIFFA